MAGRPRASIIIVDLNVILTEEAIALERWSYGDLYMTLNDTLSTIKWAAQRQLLHNNCICGECGGPCAFLKYKHGIDQYRWQCNQCSYSQSLRGGSFFCKSHLSLKQIILIAHMWSREFPQTVMIEETHVSEKGVIDWCNFLRDLCVEWKANHLQPIGGFDEDLEPVTIEIDESAFGKRKYHRGRQVRTRWVFGGVERGTGRCFAEVVENRSAATLLPLIEKWIAPGSRIVSDGWQAYNTIPEIQSNIYTHDIIVHQENFIDPNDADIHTQTIESFWNKVKRKWKRQNGTSAALFSSYVDEFVWRSYSNNMNIFSFLLLTIRQQYPV